MTRSRRPSPQTLAVLDALAQEPEAWRYGYELCLQVGLQAGSMYPILMRLADRELLETSWETSPPFGRPARHLYRLTTDGVTFAAAQAAEAGREDRVRTSAAIRPATVARPATT